MARARALTFEEFMELAMQNYNNGGDGVVECWDNRTFDNYTQEFGAMTRTKARQLFKLYKDTTEDMMGW